MATWDDIDAEQTARGLASRWMILTDAQAARPAERWRLDSIHARLMARPWVAGYLGVRREGRTASDLLADRLRTLCHLEAADAEVAATAGDLDTRHGLLVPHLFARLGLPWADPWAGPSDPITPADIRATPGVIVR
jgi:hypothetical protein